MSIGVLFCLHCALYTQDVRFIIDKNKPQLDTLDFGLTTVGTVVTGSITIENNLADTIYLPTSVSPWLVIRSFTGNLSDQQFREFDRTSNIPFSVAPRSSRTFDFKYDPQAITSDFPYGVKWATVDLGFRRTVDPPGSAPHSKTFFLKAKKVKAIVVSELDAVPFDSVYVNPTSPAQRTWFIKNLQGLTVVIDSARFQSRTLNSLDYFQLTSPSQGHVDSLPPRQKADFTVTYSPRVSGEDTVLLNVYYHTLDTNSSDFLTVILYGIGVQQHLKMVSAQSSEQINGIVGDTLDLGETGYLGSRTVSIVVENDGDLLFKTKSVTFSALLGDTAEWSFQKHVGNQGAISVTARDTILLTFEPKVLGESLLEYSVTSDLNDRTIWGVPASVLVRRLFFKTKVVAAVALRNDTLSFGTVAYSPLCVTAIGKQLRITNAGNKPLMISGMSFEPIGIPFVVVGFTPTVTIEPSQSQAFDIRFSPSSTGTFSGKLVLSTNTKGNKEEIMLVAAASEPASTSISLGDTARAKPGTEILLPVLFDKVVAETVRNLHASVKFEPSLLEFAGVQLEGTAAEGSFVKTALEFPQGELELSLDRSEQFRTRDTLLLLRFKTYLGNSEGTAIRFTSARFGTEGCEDVLRVTPNSGYFKIDSVCGLEYRILPKNSQGIEITSLSPNPAREELEIEIAVKSRDEFEPSVGCEFLNQLGEIVLSRILNVKFGGSADGGRTFGSCSFNISELPIGSYCLRLVGSRSVSSKIITVVR